MYLTAIISADVAMIADITNVIVLKFENTVNARTQPTQEIMINNSIAFFIILYYTKDTGQGSFLPVPLPFPFWFARLFRSGFLFALFN